MTILSLTPRFSEMSAASDRSKPRLALAFGTPLKRGVNNRHGIDAKQIRAAATPASRLSPPCGTPPRADYKLPDTKAELMYQRR
jgi:hypothetical protein